MKSKEMKNIKEDYIRENHGGGGGGHSGGGGRGYAGGGRGRGGWGGAYYNYPGYYGGYYGYPYAYQSDIIVNPIPIVTPQATQVAQPPMQNISAPTNKKNETLYIGIGVGVLILIILIIILSIRT